MTLKRATLHGTALHALEVLAPDTPRAPVPTAATLRPVPAHQDHYRNRAEQYDQLYQAVIAAHGVAPTAPTTGASRPTRTSGRAQ